MTDGQWAWLGAGAAYLAVLLLWVAACEIGRLRRRRRADRIRAGLHRDISGYLSEIK